jgi:ABC-type transport system involved in cytochrome c biogenesis permease subunit
MPSLWVQIGESTLLVVTLAIVLVLHDKRRKVVKSEQVMFRLVAVGIVLVVIFGFLFPITSWG